MLLTRHVAFWILGGISRLTRNLPGLKKEVVICRVGSLAKFKIRANTSDRLIISEVWELREYNDSPELTIGPRDRVVVIGAQIGVYSVLAAKKAYRGKIFSYEPYQENFALLKENVALNHLKNVRMFKMAVSGTAGKKMLYVSRSNTGAHTLFPDSRKKGVEIITTTLEKLISDNKLAVIDLLKIDVEGSEYEIILSASDRTLKKIRRIIMEYHDHIGPGMNHTMIMERL
ncbi:FkbM family methyltransferase, partial [Candidatus Amesbacteria bacterium]|nr:FkbM family methyltransferase [Candidatus Amesbacteria bacterium]